MSNIPMFTPKQSHRLSPSSARSGFALVLALGVMAFVMLLLLTISTLVQVSSKSAATQKQLTQARQNALLGVQVALGQLQKEMGPDRRISATASLLDTDPETEAIEGVGQPYWTGVWESMTWDRASQLNTPVSSLADASDGKPASFRNWLVSGFADPNLTAEQRITAARSFTPASDDAVQLLGEGTLGTAALAQTQSVYVKREAINASETSMQENGYAYWVGDEGVKARFGNPVVAEPTTNEEKLYAVSAMSRPNLQALEGWGDFTGALPNVDKVFGYGGLRATVVEDLEDTTAFDGKYHAVTPYSTGLLTDVRLGGFKKDLSLLFSGDELPNEYDEEPMFEIGNAEGATWNYLKQYYDRYKMLQSESDGTLYFDIADVIDEAKEPLSGEKKAGDTPMPVVVRIQYLFSFYRGYNTLDAKEHNEVYPLVGQLVPGRAPMVFTDTQTNDEIVYMMVTPVIYLWNPYNVAIYMSKEQFSRTAMNLLPGYLDLELSIDDGDHYVPLSNIFWVNAGELFSMNTSNTNSGDDFYIQPGALFINSLGPVTHDIEKLCVYYSDREAMFGDGIGGDDANLDGVFDDRGQFARTQQLVAGFNDGSMGFYSPRIGSDPNDRRVYVNSTPDLNIRLRFNQNQAKFIFKTSLGAEASHPRNVAGVINMDSPQSISAQYTPVEYIHNEGESVATGSLSFLYQGDDFIGLQPQFALNYDIRAFEETTIESDPRIGKPGYFTDPTNGYYYYEDADEKAFAMAPFRFWFEAIKENPVQVDDETEMAAFRTQNSDLIYSNVAKDLPVAPLLSLGQLEDAPLGRDYQHHVYQFYDFADSSAVEDLSPGSSERRNMAPVFNRAVGNGIAHPLLQSGVVWDGGFGVDRSYFLNDLLFESYFFSGIADQEGAFFSQSTTADELLSEVISEEMDFLNPNYQFVLPSEITKDEATDLLMPTTVVQKIVCKLSRA